MMAAMTNVYVFYVWDDGMMGWVQDFLFLFSDNRYTGKVVK